MKTNLKTLLLPLVITLCPLPALASTYLGEACWTLQHPDGIDRYLRFGLSYIGDTHYTVNGVWTKGDLTRKSPIHGSAEIIDGKFEISAIRTDSWSGAVRFRAMHLDLDATFNGTASWVAINNGGIVTDNEAPAVLTNCASLP